MQNEELVVKIEDLHGPERPPSSLVNKSTAEADCGKMKVPFESAAVAAATTDNIRECIKRHWRAPR